MAARVASGHLLPPSYTFLVRKLISLLIICCFLILAPTPLSAEPELPSQESVMQVADLALPESLGKIEGRFVGSAPGGRWILLIQDIHAHLSAQENISAIVDHLNQLYGIDTFALEGGWSKTRLVQSHQLPNTRAKQQLARVLLEDNYITGPFYSGLFSPQPLKLVGMEDKNLYLKNRRAFLDQADNHQEFLKKIENLGKEIAQLKTAAYSPGLLEFDSALSAFREGKKADLFLPMLLSAADRLQADLSDLDQIRLFKEILAAQNAIDKEKFKSQAGRLAALGGNASLSFEEILRSGKITDGQLAHYPEAVKFKEMLKLQDALAHHAFFDQIEKAIGRVKEKLLRTAEEKSLDGRFERFELAKKIILLEAAPSDLKRAATLKDLLRQEMAEAGLAEAFRKGTHFYHFVRKRDIVFFKNIVQQPILAGNIAVIAGGFHTEGLTARFEKLGISYLIITPSLGEENPAPANEELYLKRMREEIAGGTVKKQTLSDAGNRPFHLDRGFPKGVQVLEQTNRIFDAEQAVVDLIIHGTEEAAGSGRQNSAVAPEQFLSLSSEDQKAQVKKWLEDIQQSKLPVVLGIRTTSLKDLLQNAAAWTYWKNYIVPDRLMTIGEFQDTDEYLAEPFIGVRKHFKIKLAGERIGDSEIQQLQKGEKKIPAALIDAHFKTSNPGLLVLPPAPASLLLARLLLENKISGNVTEEFVKQVGTLLTEIFTAKGLLEQAA